MNAVLGAVQFLTRIPVRLRVAPDLARSVPWFPVVGASIGAATGAIAAGGMQILPPQVAAAVAVVAGVLITGAFHEDGLADMSDAMGGWTQQRRREILKDSRHGSYGVAAMCSTIVLRILCVASLGPAAAFAGLVAAHSMGRAASVGVMGTAAPVPVDGLGADFSRSLTPKRTVAGVIAGLVIGTLAIGWWVAPVAIGLVIGSVVVAEIARRAFGGVSGDILGAVEQVAECIVLIIVSGLALHHDVWWR